MSCNGDCNQGRECGCLSTNYIAHNAMLTEMIAADHDIIMALRQEILLMREIMTQEQMAELRELLLKSQQATEAFRTSQLMRSADPVSALLAQSSL